MPRIPRTWGARVGKDVVKLFALKCSKVGQSCSGSVTGSPFDGNTVSQYHWGWPGGVKVLGKLPVPGCPTYLNNRRALGLTALAEDAGGVVQTFSLSSIICLFFINFSERWTNID